MSDSSAPNALQTIDHAYQRISEVLTDARGKAYRAVNIAMVQSYWEIGRIVVEEEQNGKAKADYGKQLIAEFAKRLKKDFGKGFDQSNLWHMRSFYLAFPILDALRRELTWTHYRLLLKVVRAEVRQFYLDECIASVWSTRQLDRQINSFYYERILASKNKELVRKEIQTLEPGPTPQDVIKDPFILEFLDLPENRDYLEKDLEHGLIDKLHDFLLELGRGFAFVGRQQRVTADGDHFYIDLVFYNFILKCFVLIDLKTGKLTHQDIGQMDFYVRWYEGNVRAEGDNPTIGIILCAEKNETVAKYSVLEDSRQIFASRYMLYLPTEEELRAELAREKQAIESEKRSREGKDE